MDFLSFFGTTTIELTLAVGCVTGASTSCCTRTVIQGFLPAVSQCHRNSSWGMLHQLSLGIKANMIFALK